MKWPFNNAVSQKQHNWGRVKRNPLKIHPRIALGFAPPGCWGVPGCKDRSGGPSPGLGAFFPGLKKEYPGGGFPVPLEAIAVPRVPRPLHVAPTMSAARALPPFYGLGWNVPPAGWGGGGSVFPPLRHRGLVRSARERGRGQGKGREKWAGNGRGAPRNPMGTLQNPIEPYRTL